MEVLVAYDVSTVNKGGNARLRRVARIMEAYGQRVQNSVFECVLSPEQFLLLRHDLAQAINENEDSIRIYRLRSPHRKHTTLIGHQPKYDIRNPLVI